MAVQISFEYTLNRGWIFAKGEDEPAGEKNFTVPGPWLIETVEKYFSNYQFDDFLDVYEPEVEGEFIYRLAKRDGVIVEEGYNFVDTHDTFVDMFDKTLATYDVATENCDQSLTNEDLWYELACMYEENLDDLFEILPDWFEKELRGKAICNKFSGRYCSIEHWNERGGKDEYLNV